MTHKWWLHACVALLAWCATAEQANASRWSAVAGACVPDESDTRTSGGVVADWVVASAAPSEGKVYPGSTAVAAMGTVTLRCTISNPLDPIPGAPGPDWMKWELTYQDPDGLAGGTSVELYLCRMAKVTGLTTCVLQFDSDSSIAVAISYVTGGVAGMLPWNFINNYYFAKLVVADVSGAAGPPYAFGVGVFD